MAAAQAVALLETLEDVGVEAWVDGGWGVDALLGEQTRDHDDLDLVVARRHLGDVVHLLMAGGYTVERELLPTAVALRHADERAVDLHPVDATQDSGGDQVQPDGSAFHYDPPSTGVIAGRAVRCCSVRTQLAAHAGYEPDESDIADMRRLAERFDLTLSAPYDDPA